MTRKICIITGTRAEYGLLRWLIQGVAEAPELTLQLLVTGMHLSPEFGLTYREIEQDGFHIDRRVEMLTSSDTSVGISKSMGLGMIGFADVFDQLQPDLVVVLGDRFEIFAAATAAMMARIPIAHLHGGEATEGLIDEAVRHAITKMAHLHFVAAEEYQQRVIQLGELPSNVHLVGGLGIDSIKRLKLMTRAELETSLDFQFAPKNLLITYHPVTLEKSSAKQQMSELLAALSTLEDTNLIFTLPNADSDGRILLEMIAQFTATQANARAYTSLGQLRYFSAIMQVDGVVGNSSSGLLEVPSFKVGTINIGDRQLGRLQASSVINCAPTQADISTALTKLYSTDFKSQLPATVNPYGTGGAARKILKVIRNHPLTDILKKPFQDMAQS